MFLNSNIDYVTDRSSMYFDTGLQTYDYKNTLLSMSYK